MRDALGISRTVHLARHTTFLELDGSWMAVLDWFDQHAIGESQRLAFANLLQGVYERFKLYPEDRKKFFSYLQERGAIEGPPDWADSASPPAGASPVSDQTMLTAILESEGALLYLWAPWCRACEGALNLVELIARSRCVSLYSLDVSAHPTLASQIGIRTVPAAVSVVGRRADQLIGLEALREMAAVSNPGTYRP